MQISDYARNMQISDLQRARVRRTSLVYRASLAATDLRTEVGGYDGAACRMVVGTPSGLRGGGGGSLERGTISYCSWLPLQMSGKEEDHRRRSFAKVGDVSKGPRSYVSAKIVRN